MLIVFYTLQTAGISISVHYCGKKISSVSVFENKSSKKCKCSTKKMKPGCCKDKTEIIKLTSFQQKSDNNINSSAFAKSISAILIINSNLNFIKKDLSRNNNYNSKPPNDLSHPVYIRNRVLTI